MTGIWIVIISIIVLSIIITNIVALIQTLLHKKNEKYYFDKSFGAYGDKNNPKYLFNNVEHHDFFHVFYQYFICSYIPFIDVIFYFKLFLLLPRCIKFCFTCFNLIINILTILSCIQNLSHNWI